MLPAEGKDWKGGEETGYPPSIFDQQRKDHQNPIILVPAKRVHAIVWIQTYFLFPSSPLGKYQYALECRSCTLET
jgi:hypothetical protein